VRQVVLSAAALGSAEQVILAELLALRTIVLNVHIMIATGEMLTADAMQRLIDRADHDKIRKAQERLSSVSTRREALDVSL
jgi:hypothetical protein